MTSETEDLSPPEPPVAAVWARVLASVLDWMLWIPPSAALFYLALRRPDLAPACVAVWLTGKVVYEIALHAAFGATLGKMLLRIRVERFDGEPMNLNAALRRGFVSGVLALTAAVIAVGLLKGVVVDPLPASTAASSPEALRAAIESLLTRLMDHDGYRTLHQLSQLWWMLEWVTCLTNPRRRALHDFIGGTVVVKRGIKN